MVLLYALNEFNFEISILWRLYFICSGYTRTMVYYINIEGLWVLTKKLWEKWQARDIEEFSIEKDDFVASDFKGIGFTEIWYQIFNF